MTFTAHVKNIGAAGSEDTVVVSLSVDGVARATTTIAPLAAAAETTATLSGGGLGSGSHTFSVTVNEGHKIVESDFSNNTFGRDNLICL
jgi:subtilase family serine protease